MRPSDEEVFGRLTMVQVVVMHAAGTPRPDLDELYAQWSDKERSDFETHSKQLASVLVQTLRDFRCLEVRKPQRSGILENLLDPHGIAGTSRRHLAQGSSSNAYVGSAPEGNLAAY